MTRLAFRFLCLFFVYGFGSQTGCLAADAVSLTLNRNNSATLTNGLVTVEIDATGAVNALTCAGRQVITSSRSSERGYFSFVSGNTSYAELTAKSVRVVTQTDEMVELLYTNTERCQEWSIGYIMRQGVSGIYTYAIVNNTHKDRKQDDRLDEARIVWRVNPDIFNYSWVSDTQQGAMPTPAQMKNYVSEVQDATYELNDGTIYTKYDWANFIKDDQLHGLMGSDLGFWLVTPATDWINGGVGKQELTVHATDTTPLVLQMFQSMHLGAGAALFEENQQKLFGPSLIYVNSGVSHDALVADAKRCASQEAASWPYTWFSNALYPKERATVSGQIRLRSDFGTTRLQVILAKPGSNPLLQGDAYQYWTETSSDGHFTIENVRPGDYTVFAYALNGAATGTLEYGDYDITEGNNNLGIINWDAPKYEETLWQIGEADHTTAGFALSDHTRQYGLWKESPAELTYTIGTSKTSDWYYAQASQGTWTISFNNNKDFTAPLHLTIATAGAAGNVKIEVKVNSTVLKSIQYNNDAGVYRSAVLGGRDSVVVLEVPASAIRKGTNKVNLKLWNMPKNGLGGVMYDCIKLEAGPLSQSPTAIRTIERTEEDDAAVYDLSGRRIAGDAVRRGLYIRNGRKIVVK